VKKCATIQQLPKPKTQNPKQGNPKAVKPTKQIDIASKKNK
jgi:hypothetical protein